MKSSQISKLNIENFAGGIPFTARNLSIISKECKFTDFELVIPLLIEEYKINSEKPKEKPIFDHGLYIVRYEFSKTR